MGKFIHIKDIFKSNENKVSCKAHFEKTFLSCLDITLQDFCQPIVCLNHVN